MDGHWMLESCKYNPLSSIRLVVSEDMALQFKSTSGLNLAHIPFNVLKAFVSTALSSSKFQKSNDNDNDCHQVPSTK